LHCYLALLPISNATIERAFSIYNVIKSYKLSLDIIQAIMMIRYYLRIDNISCVNFKPTEAMIQKFNLCAIIRIKKSVTELTSFTKLWK